MGNEAVYTSSARSIVLMCTPKLNGVNIKAGATIVARVAFCPLALTAIGAEAVN